MTPAHPDDGEHRAEVISLDAARRARAKRRHPSSFVPPRPAPGGDAA